MPKTGHASTPLPPWPQRAMSAVPADIAQAHREAALRPFLKDSDLTLVALAKEGRNGAFRIVARRHWAAIWTFLDHCCQDASLASALTERTFQDVFDKVASHGNVEHCLRRLLLRTARDVAIGQLQIGGGAGLAPGFRRWVVSGSLRPLSVPARLTDAFQRVESRYQTALWHVVVEGESSGRAAAVLGTTRQDVTRLLEAARSSLHDSYLETLRRDTEALDDLGETSTHATHVTRALATHDGETMDPVVKQHLEGCPWCEAAFDDLTHLDVRLADQVPRLLIGWWPARTRVGPRASAVLARKRPPTEMKDAADRPRARRRVKTLLTISTFATLLITAGVVGSAEERLGDPTHRPSEAPTASNETPPPSQDSAAPTTEPPSSPTATVKPSVTPPERRTSRPSRPAQTPKPEESRERPPVVTIPAGAALVPRMRAAGVGTVATDDGARAFTDNSWIRFDNVDFRGTSYDRVRVEVRALKGHHLVQAEIQIGSPNAPATSVLANQDGPLTPTTAITAPQGVHSVYISADCSGPRHCLAVEAVTFSNSAMLD
ncbi:hypothetical protein [Streptomyces sp. NPDC054887]